MDNLIFLICVLAFLYMVCNARRKAKNKDSVPEAAAAGGKGLKGMFGTRKKNASGIQLPAPASSNNRKSKTFCKVLVFFRDEETDSMTLRDKIDARLSCTLNELYDQGVYDFDINFESFADILTVFIKYRREAS